MGFNSLFEVLNPVRHVVQHLLMWRGGIGANNGAKLFSESISEILCQYLQITARHKLIIGLTSGSVCICTVHGDDFVGFFLRAMDFGSS